MKILIKNLTTIVYKSIFNLKKNNGLRALAYHSIINKNSKDLWSLDIELFKEHISFFKKINVLSSDMLLKNEIDDGIIITFDDGYKDNIEIAAPLLIDNNIPFTIFVVTDFIRKNNKKFMNEFDLKKLSKNQLVNIGSHSKSHPRLTQCNDNDLKKEIFESKKYLEDILGKEVNKFAYPHGIFNQRVVDQVKNANYKLAFSSHYDVIKQKDNKFYLNRNEIWNSDNLTTLKSKINGDWDWLKYRKL